MGGTVPKSSAEEAVVASVLALPSHRAWRREIHRHRSLYGPSLSKAFLDVAKQRVRSRPRDAVHAARLAFLVASATDDEPGRIAALRSRADALTVTGAYAAALRSLDEARGLSVRRADERTTLAIDAARVQVLTQLERFADAVEVLRGVLDVAQGLGDVRTCVRAHLAWADLAYRRDRPREALNHYRTAESLAAPFASPRLVTAISENRANCLLLANRFRAALRQHARARALFESEGCSHTVAQVDYNTAGVDLVIGRFQDALDRLASAERVFEALGDERHLAQVALDRAEVYLHLNHVPDAAHFAEEADERFRALGVSKERAQAIVARAKCAALLGKHEQAFRLWDRAAADFRGLGLAERDVAASLEAAWHALDLGQHARAGEAVARARMGLGEETNPLVRARLELTEARLAIAAEEPEEAARLASAVLVATAHVYAPLLDLAAWQILGRARARLGARDAAVAAYQRAVDVLEHAREGVPPDEYMASFLDGHASVYDEIVDLLLDSGDTELAFEYSERARGRALADLLDPAVPRAPGTKGGVPSRRVRYLRERLHGIYRRLERFQGDAPVPSTRTLRRALGDAESCEIELARRMRQSRLALDPPRRSSRPERRLRTAAAPTTTDALIGRLDEGTALLEYFLTQRWLTVFSLTRDGLRVARLPRGSGDVKLRLERFLFHLHRHEHPYPVAEALLRDATRANLAPLADDLLSPLHGDGRVSRLIVVPHGDLHHIPFHALPWEDGWLSERFEVVVAPSAALYAAPAPQHAVAEPVDLVFGLADPRAPKMETEARAVAARLRTPHCYVGREATWARLSSLAARARVLHVATHGMFRHREPTLSAFRLADRWVTLYDLYELGLDGALVVLSACEGGMADVTRGDEILGLRRGFLAAGARVVMAAGWRVEDDVAALFMEAFYADLASSGDAVHAHRKAMSEVRSRYAHPYYWAPFSLTGRPDAWPGLLRPSPTAVGASTASTLATETHR